MKDGKQQQETGCSTQLSLQQMFQKPITTASKTDALHSKKNYDEPLEIIP
jgi:hypothetical protein